MIKKLMIFCFLFSVASTNSFAKFKLGKPTLKAPPTLQGQYQFMSDKDYEMAISNAEKMAERKISSSDASTDSITADMMSKELNEFINRIIKIKTADELEALINKIDSEYETYPTDLKFYVAQIVPLRASRGWLYKIRPLFESHKLTHSVLLTMAKSFATAQSVLFPQAHWEAAYDFVTSPSKTDKEFFNDISEIQNFAVSNVYNELLKASNRLKELKIESYIIWDNRVNFGTDSFKDDLARFRYIREGEKHAVIASLDSAMANILIGASYNMQDALNVSSKFGNLAGYDVFSSSVNGVTAKERRTVLMKFPKFLTIKEDKAINEYLTIALSLSKESIREAKIAYTQLKKIPKSPWNFIDYSALNTYQDTNLKTLNNLENAFSKPYEIKSVVTGNILQTNIPLMFTKPPHDLKVFLPNKFNEQPEFLPNEVRNFKSGRAIGWDLNQFKPYFPNITDTGIETATQILNQAWGGAFGVGAFSMIQ
jgi:hypothetical protein